MGQGYQRYHSYMWIIIVVAVPIFIGCEGTTRYTLNVYGDLDDTRVF
jgi:hypothetical protein